jgi:uncharacterized protein (DUF433 family)
MFDWSKCTALERDPQRVSGEWVFKNTRVPVRTLFENLEDGASIDEFLERFPGVYRSQIESVLAYTGLSLFGKYRWRGNLKESRKGRLFNLSG